MLSFLFAEFLFEYVNFIQPPHVALFSRELRTV